MATTYKPKHYKDEIKVRRLLWKEVTKLRKLEEDAKDNFEVMRIVMECVVEPKEAIDELDVKEVKNIVDYAWGLIDDLTT